MFGGFLGGGWWVWWWVLGLVWTRVVVVGLSGSVFLGVVWGGWGQCLGVCVLLSVWRKRVMLVAVRVMMRGMDCGWRGAWPFMVNMSAVATVPAMKPLAEPARRGVSRWGSTFFRNRFSLSGMVSRGASSGGWGVSDSVHMGVV